MVFSATLRTVLSRTTTSRLTIRTPRMVQRRGCPVCAGPVEGCEVTVSPSELGGGPFDTIAFRIRLGLVRSIRNRSVSKLPAGSVTELGILRPTASVDSVESSDPSGYATVATRDRGGS